LAEVSSKKRLCRFFEKIHFAQRTIMPQVCGMIARSLRAGCEF
jgi:hypothetical protein